MTDEATLRERFPEIPWDEPVEVHILADNGPWELIRVGERTGTYWWACRYCIALLGLKAQDVMHGRTDAAYESKAEALAHIEEAHLNGPRRIRFLADDPGGLWRKGDRGYDLGREHPEVPVWQITLSRTGETLTLEEPFARGLIELDE